MKTASFTTNVQVTCGETEDVKFHENWVVGDRLYMTLSSVGSLNGYMKWNENLILFPHWLISIPSKGY